MIGRVLGIDPGAVAAGRPTVDDVGRITELRLRHLASHLHGLGPRATYELLKEIAGGADAVECLERYARIDPDVVEAPGADRMPPRLTLIAGGMR
jgi:hypothetical protein